jgi:hypothetical protein
MCFVVDGLHWMQVMGECALFLGVQIRSTVDLPLS